VAFVRGIIGNEIKKTKLPNEMVNHDALRVKDQESAKDDVERAILSEYVEKQSGFKRYVNETPYNKMLLWGVVFESLYNVLIGDTLKQYPRKIKKINAQQYAKLPKRYRSIFHKDDRHPYLYTTILKDKSEKFTVGHNFKIDEPFEVFTKRIRDLISVLYKEEITETWEETIDRGYNKDDGTYWESGKIHHEYGQIANTVSTKSNFISDEQLNAIIELQKIFTKIASEVHVTKTKHGNTDVWNEMQDAESRDHIFWRAQKLTRTVNQLVVSTRKAAEFCDERQIRQATEHYDSVKKSVMNQLRKKTSVRIK
jgi:hypothetical protein